MSIGKTQGGALRGAGTAVAPCPPALTLAGHSVDGGRLTQRLDEEGVNTPACFEATR